MSKFTPLEHYEETINLDGDFQLHYQTVREVGGKNIVRMQDAKLAKLFAAAPDMYNQLCELSRLYQSAMPGEDFHAVMLKMEKLLKKVEGGE